MDILKKVFPVSFRFSDTVANLVVGIIIYVLLGTVAGVLLGFVPNLPVVNILTALTSSVISLYGVGGIVILILSFTRVLK